MELLERQKRIIAFLKQTGTVSVNELTQLLDVSPATVRRDLEVLEQENLLRRVYGGAIEFQKIGYEPGYIDRLADCLNEKIALARVAASLVEPGDILAIDAGTTTGQIARLLGDVAPLTILTPSLTIAQIFADLDNSEHTVILPGGILRTRTRSLVGPLAEENLLKYRCNKAFIGCQSITAEDGAMNVNLLAISTKRALVDISQQVIVVADHSKFGRRSLAAIAATEEIDVLVTDSKTGDAALQPFRDAGVTVLVAP